MGQVRVGGRVGGLQQADGFDRPVEVRPCHQVRVQVVVHNGAVLVRPGDRVDVEAALGPAEEAKVGVQPCGLDQHRQGLADEEPGVTAHVGVLADREGHVRVDVVLRRAGSVVGRSLLAVDGAPGEEGAALGHLLRPLPRLVEHRDPEPQRAPRQPRVGVGEERDEVDLGVPEVVALVAGAGDALRADAGAVRPGRCLRQLEQAPAHGLLQRGLAVQLHVGARPVVVEPVLLLDLDGLASHGLRVVDGQPGKPDEVGDLHLRRAVVVGGPLQQQDRLAHGCRDPVGAASQVGVDLRVDRHGVGRVQLVVDDDRQAQP